MTLEKLEHYQELAAWMVEHPSNLKQRDLWNGIDFMYESGFNVPVELQNKPWIGNLKLSDPIVHDMISGAISAFATKLPQISVRPMTESEDELVLTEHMEVVLRWHFELLNRRSKKSAHWKIVENAIKYSAVALQTRYMPYEIKSKRLGADKKKELLARGAFNWVVHHPGNVYPVWTDDELEGVLLHYVRSIDDLVREFGKNNTGIQKLLKAMTDDKTQPSSRMKTFASFFDWTDSGNRVIYCIYNGTNTASVTEGEGIEIRHKEHKLPFIPWVCADYQDPIMKGIWDSGLYDIQNIVKTIEYAKHVSSAAHSNYEIATPNPDNPNLIIGEDPNNPMIHDTMTAVRALPPPQIDPGLRVTIGETAGAIMRSGRTRALIGVEEYVGSQVPYSALNAAQGAAVAQLSLPAMVIERAEEEAMHQMCKWIKYSKEPLIGFRKSDKVMNGVEYKAGKEYMLNVTDNIPEEAPEDQMYIDPNMYYIDIALRPSTVQDEQGQTNLAIQQVASLGLPPSEGLEMIGRENAESMIQKRMMEDFAQGFKNAKLMEIDAKGQAVKIIEDAKAKAEAMVNQAMSEIQAQQEQTQKPTSPETQVKEMNAGSAFDNVKGRGFDPRAGGQSPYAVVPTENRNSITGTTDTGEEVL